MIETKRPKCACGNTQNPDGYCDGSHGKKYLLFGDWGYYNLYYI
jgi:hypothetical protein